MERLDVPRDRVLGIDLVLADGTLSCNVKEPIPALEGKVEALRQHVGRPPDIVLSDSLYDLPLFEYSAGLKVLVNSNGHPSSDFFSSGHVPRDDSWVVVESPTLRS
jgi:phosphoserine phosphatase